MKLVGFFCLWVGRDIYVHPKDHAIGFDCKVRRVHIGVYVWNPQRLQTYVQKDCAETTVLAQCSDALGQACIQMQYCRMSNNEIQD
eukprot:11303936-Ditylum_brightwellii.AAC.1